jgi:hypothetical protein
VRWPTTSSRRPTTCANERHASYHSLGSRSRPLTTAQQWLQARGLSWEDVKPTRSRHRKADVLEGEMSFLNELPRAVTASTSATQKPGVNSGLFCRTCTTRTLVLRCCHRAQNAEGWKHDSPEETDVSVKPGHFSGRRFSQVYADLF